MRKWLTNKKESLLDWFAQNRKVLFGIVGDDLREIAILWLVFSFLEKILRSGELSVEWMTRHATVSFALWISGTFFTVLKDKGRRQQ